MYILIILNFIFSCCLGVFFFIKLKEKEDDIDELYEIFYKEIENVNNHQNKTKNSNNKGRVIRI